MLIIRKEQESAFVAMRVDAFVRRASEQLKDAFPTQARALGAEALRVRVRRAIERCEARGIVQENNVYAYLEWTFVLGDAFDDEDGPHPWASSILDDASVPEAVRMRQLGDAAARFTDVGGTA